MLVQHPSETLPTESDVIERLEQRLGRVHARQRLGMEAGHESHVFGQGINFFHPENWYSIHSMIRAALKLSGLYWRGCRNAERVQLRHNEIELAGLPPLFDGFKLLQISDLHVEMNPGAMRHVIELVKGLKYDVCVLTGDYRGKAAGPYEKALAGVARLRSQLKDPVYGLLGNHDTVRMVPELEEMGIRMLLNEAVMLSRGGQRLHLAGIDDAHYFRADNIQKAAADIPHDEFSILLSHTPEIYRQAAHADFNLLLCGHTHGGQVCLPGSIPFTLDAALPRRYGRGLWKFHTMVGYTTTGAGSSIVAVRFNCPAEITLHTLRRPQGAPSR